MTADTYHEAWKVIPLLVVYYSIKSVYYFYIDQCLFYKNTSNKVFIASITSNICNIIAAFFLVPVLGMYGTALATIISVVILTVIVYFISKRWAEHDIGYRMSSFIGKISFSWVFIVVGIIPNYIVDSSEIIWSLLLLKIVILLLYFLIIWKTNKKNMYILSNTGSVKEIINKLFKKND